MNLIDHIGNKVTLWTKEGNAMERRTLITADEMGIVVEPYTDPDDGPLPDQDHEVFVPWNRVKYVDLIKPYELLCDICKNPLGDNGIEFTTDGARHTDCKPVKPPSPEFIAKVKEITEPQRAQVGDIVKLKVPQDTRTYRILEVNHLTVWARCLQNDLFGNLGHDEYTIVKRADGCTCGDEEVFDECANKNPLACVACGSTSELMTFGGKATLCQQCINDHSVFVISELVEMLAKREAIAFDELVPEDRDAIIQWEKKTNLWSLHTARFKGPVRILVIPE